MGHHEGSRWYRTLQPCLLVVALCLCCGAAAAEMPGATAARKNTSLPFVDGGFGTPLTALSSASGHDSTEPSDAEFLSAASQEASPSTGGNQSRAALTWGDMFSRVMRPERAQPFYFMPLANNIKGIVTIAAFALDLKFQPVPESERFRWSRRTVAIHIVSTGVFVCLAMNSMHADLIRWRAGSAGCGFRGSFATLLATGLTSSNYGAAVIMWTKVQVQSPGALLKLERPKYKTMPLCINSLSFPISPVGALWLRPLTWLYAVLLLPYLFVPLVIYLVGAVWISLVLLAGVGMLAAELALGVSILYAGFVLADYLFNFADCVSELVNAAIRDWNGGEARKKLRKKIQDNFNVDIDASAGRAAVIFGSSLLVLLLFITYVFFNIIVPLFHLIASIGACVFTFFAVRQSREWTTYWAGVLLWKALVEWWVFPYFFVLLLWTFTIPFIVLDRFLLRVEEVTLEANCSCLQFLMAQIRQTGTRESGGGGDEDTECAIANVLTEMRGLASSHSTDIGWKWRVAKSFLEDVAYLFVPMMSARLEIPVEQMDIMREFNRVNLIQDFEDFERDDGERRLPLLATPHVDKIQKAQKVRQHIVLKILQAGSYVTAQTVMGITLLRLIWGLGLDPERMTFAAFRDAFGATLWERHLLSYMGSLRTTIWGGAAESIHRFDILWGSL